MDLKCSSKTHVLMARSSAAGTAEREENLRRKVEPPWRKYAIEGSFLSALGIPVLSLFTSSHDANSIFRQILLPWPYHTLKGTETNDHGYIPLNHEPK